MTLCLGDILDPDSDLAGKENNKPDRKQLRP